MKKIFIIIVCILIILGGIFLTKNQSEKKFNYEIQEINEYNYFVYKENEFFGVINKEGKTIVSAKFQNVIIPNPEKDIFICYNEEKPEVLNSNGEKLFTEYDEVEPIKLKSSASTLAYEKSVLKYKKDGLYGLINFQGKSLTKNIYSTIENLEPTEGKLLVSKENKQGVIDIKANKLVDVKYDKVVSDEYFTIENEYKKSGFLVSIKKDDGYKFGYVDYKGKTILNSEYNEIERIPNKNDKITLIVSNNGKYGLYKKSKKIIDTEFQSIVYDENLNLLIVQKNKKFGVYSLEGKKIIEPNKEEISSRGIYLYVKSQDGNKVYDEKGKEVDINYNRSIYKTENDEYRISTILNNNITYYGIINKEQAQLVQEKYRYIEYLYNNYFIATNDEGDLGVINNNGKVVLDMKYNLLQKIKGMNIVQAGIQNSNKIEFYSQEMKKVLEVENPNIELKKDYVIISNENQKSFLDKNGNEIKDVQNLEKSYFPDKVGEYKKMQITIDTLYYIK